MINSALRFWLFLIPVLATVATIWLPTGLSEIPQVEEWQVFSIFQERAPVFWVTTGDFQAHRLRPLFLFLDAVAFSTPVPYLTMHALLALALIVKGVAMAYVTHWLTQNRLLSVLAAAIFILNPADTMQMGFRSLVIIWPVALSVSAMGLLLASTDASNHSKKIILAGAAAALMLVAGLMYEAALMMAAAPLVLMLSRYGTKAYGMLLTSWRQALIWSAAIIVNLLYITIQTSSGRTYQGALLAGAPPISEIPKYLVTTGLYRALLQGWHDGLFMFSNNLDSIPYLVGAIALCVLSFIGISVNTGFDQASLSARLGVRTLLAGVFLAALGYAPFLVSTPHIHITQRTYLFASIGGSIFIVGILILLKRSNIAVATLASVLVVSGMGSQWEQLAHYSELSGRQQMYLSGILNAAPDAGKQLDQTLLITDKTGAMSNTWMLRGENLAAALSYIYGRSVRAFVCSGPGELLSSFTTDSFGTPGKCVATDKGWEIGKGAANAFELAKESTTHIVIDPDGNVTRLTGDAVKPDSMQMARARSILGCFPCSYVPREPVGTSFKFDFSKWWSLDSVPWGGGWSDAGWIIPPATPVSYAWMIAPTSNLFFRLLPQGPNYRVSVRIVGSVSTMAKESLALSINGKRIDYHWMTPEVLVGSVESSVFLSGLNELRLEAVAETQFSVTNEIDWIEIAPVR